MTGADLLLHPVRLRIVQAFLGDGALTTRQLRSRLPGVPVASLYRHVALLVDRGVLVVDAEHRVRGAQERTYVLRTVAANISLEELAKVSPDDQRQAFLVYVAGLVRDFDRYVAKENIDLLRDGVSYRTSTMWLDDAELAALLSELLRVFQSRLANTPTPARTRRILGTILLPGSDR